jgi:Xaa-Pro aminopeptidase
MKIVGVVAGLCLLASVGDVAVPARRGGDVTVSASLFDKPEYAARRSRLMAQLGEGAAVFLGAATPSSDVAFRQGHDFFYMSGVEIPDAILVVDGMRKESVLFFTMTESDADGLAIPLELVRTPAAYTGIERVLPIEQFDGFLARLANRNRPLYTMFKPEEIGPENSNEKFNALQQSMTLNRWDGRLTRELQFVKQVRERFPQVDLRDSSPLVWNQRKLKSPAELAIMRQVARIGVQAHNALIQSTRPGIAEKALAAVFEFVSAQEGARGLAYYTIIMSGKNHAYGHYHAHDRVLAEGDFVILDAAPDYGNYHVDISTTFPASGKFSPRQRELYEVALAVREVALANYRPGTTFGEVGQKVDAMLKTKGLDGYAGDFDGIVRLGGYNHSIGLATHDVMGSFAGADEVLQPGFVFACDIQLYRVDEQIGIRIEDTVVITDTGYEVLSVGVPRTVAEIEALMKKDGILQILKKSGGSAAR